MTDDQHGARVKQKPETDYPTCPCCGGGSFYVDGFLSYRQRYDSESDRWGTSVIDWEFDNPVRAYCAMCETDVSLTLRERGILDLYDVSWKRRHS